MHNDPNTGVCVTDSVDVIGQKFLVDATIAVPEDNPAVLELLGTVSAPPCLGTSDSGIVPAADCRFRNPHFESSVPTKMLIGKEEHPTLLFQGGVKDSFRIGGSTGDPAMLTAERFQFRCRINVSDRHNIVYINQFRQLIPASFDRLPRCHICHTTTGFEVGQQDIDSLSASPYQIFRTIRQNVCGLCHKVNSAEDNRFTVCTLCGGSTQLETVPLQVGMDNHLFPLIMVSENEQPPAKPLPDSVNMVWNVGHG